MQDISLNPTKNGKKDSQPVSLNFGNFFLVVAFVLSQILFRLNKHKREKAFGTYFMIMSVFLMNFNTYVCTYFDFFVL